MVIIAQTKSELEERLSTVRNAIYAIMVGGQSYKIGSRSLTRANLAELRELEADLEARIASDSSSALFDDCYVAIFDGR